MYQIVKVRLPNDKIFYDAHPLTDPGCLEFREAHKNDFEDIGNPLPTEEEVTQKLGELNTPEIVADVQAFFKEMEDQQMNKVRDLQKRGKDQAKMLGLM